ncbi:MAG TPA: hypothetical protein VJT50_05965, partial [Pyrinomonadaceae bacterium]|nr:hypothetical protein [Pyrinomonadaceae bacterium]
MKPDEQENNGIVRYRFESNGSLTIQSIAPSGGRAQRLRIGPGSRVSIVTAAENVWQDLELRAGRTMRNRLLVTLRTARGEKDGIRVTNVARNDRGRVLQSSGVIAGKADDPWHSNDVRSNGLRIETDGKGKLAWRTSTDAQGLIQWRSEPTPGTMAVMSSSAGNAS